MVTMGKILAVLWAVLFALLICAVSLAPAPTREQTPIDAMGTLLTALVAIVGWALAIYAANVNVE